MHEFMLMCHHLNRDNVPSVVGLALARAPLSFAAYRYASYLSPTYPAVSFHLVTVTMTFLSSNMELGYLAIVVVITGLIIVYWLSRSIYNLYFHALAGFPGPRWAAISYLPEFYYDFVKGGLYLRKIAEMHEVYGRLPAISHNVSDN